MSATTNSAGNSAGASAVSSHSELAQSYAWCERVARSQAKNFYYSFLLLPSSKRQAMCAIYAFMRYCDDLSDDDGIADRAASIAQWRNDLEAALSGRAPSGAAGSAVWPAFVDTVSRFKIPHQYFFDMIDGVSSDLEPRDIQTFDQLYAYCYRVASVVGLTIVHIFEFSDPRALELAEKCGIAFQVTNILRDVREDAEKQRVYLPAEDLARFGVSPATFAAPDAAAPDAFRKLMAFEADRARKYFNESKPLIAMVNRRSRASLEALIAIYSRLLDKIVASNYDVLSQRIRLSTATKLWLLVRSARKEIALIVVLLSGLFAVIFAMLRHAS